MKKLLALLLVLVMSIGCLAGCGKKDDNNTPAGGEELEHVNLVMYLIGSKPNDYDKAIEELNKLLKEDINATVEVRWMSWGDYGQKYPVLMAAGEEFDLIYSVDWNKYAQYSRDGGYMDITELLPVYAPKSFAALDETQKDLVRVDGKMYALPANATEVNPGGYVVRGDLMKKYGMDTISSFDDFMDYLKAVKENESGLMPIAAAGNETMFEFKWGTIGTSNIVYNYGTREFDKLFYRYDNAEFLHMLDRMREGYENGYWSKDVVMNTVASKDAFLAGTSAAATCNLKNFNELRQKADPSWDVQWYPKTGDMKNCLKTGSQMMSVAASSKNPERALMFLELLNTDSRYYNLTTYGIEGVHFVINSEGKYDFPEGVTLENTGFTPDGAGNWGWNSNALALELGYAWEGEKAIKEDMVKNGAWSAYLGFAFDNTPVSNEIAAVNAVNSEYWIPLSWGLVEVESGVKKWVEQLENAGIGKIMDEVTKQTQEFLKNK